MPHLIGAIINSPWWTKIGTVLSIFYLILQVANSTKQFFSRKQQAQIYFVFLPESNRPSDELYTTNTPHKIGCLTNILLLFSEIIAIALAAIFTTITNNTIIMTIGIVGFIILIAWLYTTCLRIAADIREQ